MITFSVPKHNWNYFLEVEKDLEKVSRYIEFSQKNMDTYSIVLAHILLSASSEIDVVLKQLCALIEPKCKTDNIDHYQKIIRDKLSEFVYEEVTINRFGLVLKPWDNWLGNVNPDWWKSHNNIKHHRNDFFEEANLLNTLNAVSGLLISVVYYYKIAFSFEKEKEVNFKETTRQLEPNSTLLKMNSTYYYDTIVI